MDLASLRALVLDTNLSVHGVPVTVTRPAPDNTPIETRGIWLTFTTEDVPAASEFQRREPLRAMALSRVDVPTVKRGTVIAAPAPGTTDDTVLTWVVDGTLSVEADHVRVIVLPGAESES